MLAAVGRSLTNWQTHPQFAFHTANPCFPMYISLYPPSRSCPSCRRPSLAEVSCPDFCLLITRSEVVGCFIVCFCRFFSWELSWRNGGKHFLRYGKHASQDGSWQIFSQMHPYLSFATVFACVIACEFFAGFCQEKNRAEGENKKKMRGGGENGAGLLYLSLFYLFQRGAGTGRDVTGVLVFGVKRGFGVTL